MANRETDEQHVRAALDLAGQGIGLTSPNPCVGAVIVDQDGKVVGTGFHTYEGVKHAEVLALEKSGGMARGSTIYLNLEPCSHRGRTGPCADALIAAGIRRVVASISDPNPAVSGNGFARLREAGVTVATGIMEAEARRLNESFAKFIRHHTPLVSLKTAMTLDGKIAAPPKAKQAHRADKKDSDWITGAEARAHVQQLRHQSDAIMVGVGTVIADDPLLTDRSGLPRRRKLVRVILDSHLRLPLTSRIAQTAEDDVVVMCVKADEDKRKKLEERGVRVEAIFQLGADGRPEMSAILENLGSKAITSVLIEGGAGVNGSALRSGMVDKLFFYYGSKILGGTDSVPFSSGSGFAGIAEAARVKSTKLHQFGEDFAVEGYLRDPYRD